MQSDLNEYWRVVNEIEGKELPPGDTIYITSMPQRRGDPSWRPGIVAEAGRRNAALRLASSTHRLATAEEIAGCIAAKAGRERDLALVEDRRRQNTAGGGGILKLAAEAQLRALGEV
jgi:hypothetical protein